MEKYGREKDAMERWNKRDEREIERDREREMRERERERELTCSI